MCSTLSYRHQSQSQFKPNTKKRGTKAGREISSSGMSSSGHPRPTIKTDGEMPEALKLSGENSCCASSAIERERRQNALPKPKNDSASRRHEVQSLSQAKINPGQTRQLQKCRKIRGLGCVNQACTSARVTQPSPHIFLHICRALEWTGVSPSG